MLVFYKRHVITVLVDQILTAEVTEQATRAVLPTKVSASFDEGLDRVVERAKALVDLYTAPSPMRPAAGKQGATFRADRRLIGSIHADARHDRCPLPAHQ